MSELSTPRIADPLPGWPVFGEDEIAAATEVMRSGKVNYWTGDQGRSFEAEFAQWVGTHHAIALANGTVALEGALRALGIGPGDEVVVTPRSFLASASCVIALGARPVFADVDPESQNITAASIEPVLTTRTRAIIAVHLAGWPCDMDEIMALADARRLVVIEDCAQSHGARWRGRMTGALGHMGAFSFCQDKILTTLGEGGMVTTNDAAAWDRLWSYKDHGKSWSAVFERDHPPGYRWVHSSFGSNWRMTEVQAAQGRVALRKLDASIARRRQHANRLTAALSDLSAVRVPAPGPDVEHSYYKFYAFVRPDALATGWSRDRIMNDITDAGAPCGSGSCSEVYLEQAFDGSDARPSVRLPVAKALGETSLMFLVHPTLGDGDVDRVASVARHVLRRATR